MTPANALAAGSLVLLTACSAIPARSVLPSDALSQTGTHALVFAGTDVPAPPRAVAPAAAAGPLDPATVDAKSQVTIGGDVSTRILMCPQGRLHYIPVPALPAAGYTDVEIDASGRSIQKLKKWGTPEETNKLLTNIATEIVQTSAEGSGGIGSVFTASASKKQYVIDFMKYRSEPISPSNDPSVVFAWARVGAGLRLIVNITKGDGTIGGSLLALAASAKGGHLEGSISTELIGIDSPEVTQAMPFTVDISEGNVQRVVEALAIVKTKLYDAKTTIAPNLIARIECTPDTTKPGK